MNNGLEQKLASHLIKTEQLHQILEIMIDDFTDNPGQQTNQMELNVNTHTQKKNGQIKTITVLNTNYQHERSSLCVCVFILCN